MGPSLTQPVRAAHQITAEDRMERMERIGGLAPALLAWRLTAAAAIEARVAGSGTARGGPGPYASAGTSTARCSPGHARRH